jgi:type IV secretion system protein VirB4
MAQTSDVRERDLETLRDISDDVIESDFVPYACLFDRDTIVTKDGELLQTIKITGLGVDAAAAGKLRQNIRAAIRQSLPDDSYAIWLHTLRRRQQRGPRPAFADPFSTKLDEAWQTSQPASAFFTNELYITIVKAGGEAAGLRNLPNLIQTLYPGRDRNRRSAELEQFAEELSKTTQDMLKILGPFGGRLLTIVARDGVYYSEQLEFLEKLINLEERPMPVPERDLSQVLTSGDITFGYNAMEVRTAEGHRRFAAVLTLKEYKESTLAGIDSFLEIPCEIIISQCFSFTGAEEAQESYAKQARYLSISGDKELAKWMEIDRLMQMSGAAGNQEYGQQQTSMFLIAPSIKQLELNIKLVQKSLGKLGMIVVREDLRFEECYWAQLPGNFPFVVRKRAIDTEHLAGFANLQSAPMGNAAGSPWGSPVSLLTTVQEAPYFFNFHRGDCAHTIILGKPGTGRTSLTHFLLAQARKLPISIWYLDCHGRAGTFLKAIGGSYSAPGTAGLKLNPLHMVDTQSNREFLALWLSTLIDPHGHGLNRSTLAFFQSLIAQVMAVPREHRRLSTMLPTIRDADPALATALSRFCEGGIYGALFDMPEDNFKPGDVTGWDISGFMADPLTRIPLTSYLLHRLTSSLTGKPTLIVLDDGFHILDTPLFAPRAVGWIDHLTSKNAAAILSTDDVSASGALAFTSGISKKAATIFALPDRTPDAEYAMGFGLSAEEMATLAYNHTSDHHVLQKRGSEATVLKMSFAVLNDITRQTLCGRAKPQALNPADELAALMGYGKPAA